MKFTHKRDVVVENNKVYMIKEEFIESEKLSNYKKVKQEVTLKEIDDMIKEDKENMLTMNLERSNLVKSIKESEKRLKNLVNQREYIQFKKDIRKYEFYNKLEQLDLNKNIFVKKIRTELEEFIKNKNKYKQHFITYDDEQNLLSAREKLVSYNDVDKQRAEFLENAERARKALRDNSITVKKKVLK